MRGCLTRLNWTVALHQGVKSVRMVGRWGDRQKLADRLDPMDGAMIIDERDHLLNGRSSSAIAKYADAFLRISLA